MYLYEPGSELVIAPPFSIGRRTLRDYQIASLSAANKEFAGGITSTLVVLPTGMGKTVLFAKMASEWQRGNVLILAHRIELLEQAADKLAPELGYRPPIEQGQRGLDDDSMWQGGNVVVGSVATLKNIKRMAKYQKFPFGLVIIDECFPAGTLVDGIPIEDITEGDIVTSFDVASKKCVKRRVVRKFKKPAPSIMVRISTSRGVVTATPNHPFFTNRGWVDAGRIEVGDCVYGMRQDVHASDRAPAIQTSTRRDKDVVQSSMPCRMGLSADSVCLRSVRAVDHGCRELASVQSQKQEASLLFGGMHETGDGVAIISNDGINKSPLCIEANEGEQSDGQRGRSHQSFGNDAIEGMQTDNSRRQWSRIDGPRISPFQPFRLEAIRPEHTHGQIEWISDSLQNRFGRSDTETFGGNRWWQSQELKSQSGGRSQDGILAGERVDSVEVLECGSLGEPNEVCWDGFVYNLEVEGEHTYIANGFAVHNCHHAISASYKRIMESCLEFNADCRFLGVTATPNRSDNASLGIVFNTVAYTMNIQQGIKLGWLVPIHQEYVHLSEDAVDFSNLTLTRNKFGEADFPKEQLEAILTEENALHAMSRPILDKTMDGKQCLVFNAGVAHAHLMGQVLNRYKPNSTAAVDGKTDPQKRFEIVNAFHRGEIQYLLNYGVFTEGFDAPATSMIVMGRPTKSVSLHSQMLGRGTRPLTGVVDGLETAEERCAAIAASAKPYMTVLDFVGNSRHKPVSAFDALGGDYDVQVRELAESRAKRQAGDIQEILEEARVDYALLAEEKTRKDIKAASVRYTTERVDVFGPSSGGIGNDMDIARGGASNAQIGALVNLGIAYATAAGYSRGQAGAVITSIGAKRCTTKQQNVLKKYGYDPNVPMKEASKIIDKIAANGWKRP